MPFEGADERRTISRITLTFDSALNPYMDPEAMRPVFLKIFGPPDTSIDHAVWGDPHSNDPYIRAYSYEGRFWVSIENGKPADKVEEKPRSPA